MEINQKDLCDKIQTTYPDIGYCGIDIETSWDEDTGSWIVYLERDGKKLTTHLETDDAENCMEGKECVHLGLQVAQLSKNI